ncbi:uncharacterized protein CDAR_44391 [Caerostris darwini]|uniref:Uncharacterized protein n=1 Tax=Caerostris darwini TaxID=1538125 RepID=A0AAV4QPY9_9ARAC|nr:uncharacterized protein CDAR_44391 [Caerostris darwini]
MLGSIPYSLTAILVGFGNDFDTQVVKLVSYPLRPFSRSAQKQVNRFIVRRNVVARVFFIPLNIIWTEFYHKVSTDENPQHSYCPVGPESWRKWRKSEAEGTFETFEHPPALDDEAQEILKPIYEDLTADDLLERCLGNNTQNNNEISNSCVRQLAPKINLPAKKIADDATYCAACTFNEGFTAILKIMDVRGIKIGPQEEQLA